jgi:hypothetical protein
VPVSVGNCKSGVWRDVSASGFAICAVPLLSGAFGWRGAFPCTAAVAASAALIWTFMTCAVPARVHKAAPLLAMLRSPQLWLLGLVQMASFGLVIVVGVWIFACRPCAVCNRLPVLRSGLSLFGTSGGWRFSFRCGRGINGCGGVQTCRCALSGPGGRGHGSCEHAGYCDDPRSPANHRSYGGLVGNLLVQLFDVERIHSSGPFSYLRHPKGNSHRTLVASA